MGKPKPPTPASVSATLRTAGFRASPKASTQEGYRVGGNDALTVWVGFTSDDPAVRADALVKMGATLSRKGWAVSTERADLLLVRER